VVAVGVHDEVELEVLRAVEREACVHVAGIAQAYPGVEAGDVATALERLVTQGQVAGVDLTVHRGEVHDVTLTESGQSRLAASRPDGDPH
jgi:hypothetical protein